MSEWLKERWQVLKAITDRRWFKVCAVILSTIGLYDTLGDQILPKWLADKLPPVRDLLDVTTGWLPWWAWGWIGTALLSAASIEYAVRVRQITKQNRQQGAVSNIRFEGITQETSEEVNTGRPDGYYTFITVRNASNAILERCLVKVERIRTGGGSGQEIQAALTTQARFWSGQPGRFALAPDERKRILLTVRETVNPRRPAAHVVSFEAHQYPIHRGTSCIVDLIAVADVGPPDRIQVRLAVDDHYVLTYEILAERSLEAQGAPETMPSIAARESKADLAKALHEFVHSAVIERNRLIPPFPQFDYDSERKLLVAWSDTVVDRLDNEFVTVGERSRFEILGEYEPEPMNRVPIDDRQLQIQTMWTEKLKRLRRIIDGLGADHSSDKRTV